MSGRAAAGAWAALLLGSALPFTLWRALSDEPMPVWVPAAQALALAAVLAAARRTSLRGLLLALVALQVGIFVVELVRALPPYERWLERAPEYQDAFAGAFLQLVPGLLMLATALRDGLSRRDLFLQRGDLAAPAALPGTRRRVSWRVLGPLLVALFTVPLAVQLTFSIGADADRAGTALALLPLALVFGAVNAFSEELRFRCVLLARLLPVVSAESAIWMTALFFGLPHWYGGNPSGPSGFVMTALVGAVWAKSMLETRGLFWAWAMHAALDVVIFTFLVMDAG